MTSKIYYFDEITTKDEQNNTNTAFWSLSISWREYCITSLKTRNIRGWQLPSCVKQACSDLERFHTRK